MIKDQYRAWDTKGHNYYPHIFNISKFSFTDPEMYKHLIFEQCVGAEDMTNKLIYHKDILQKPSSGLYLVEWDNNESRFCLIPAIFLQNFQPIELAARYHSIILFEQDVKQCKIVGNFNENKSLLRW